MKVVLIFLFALLCTLPLADCRRGGGGGRGGGRGSSRGSSGSRGSSSRGSSSRGSQTSSQRTIYERKSSGSSSEQKAPPKPSAPELPVSAPKPSAPDLPTYPKQPAYNPNYGKPPGSPPAYPGGNAAPPAGPPPSYPGAAQLPPYPGPQARPPAYDFGQRQPNPSGGVSNPSQPAGSAPYPRQPGAPYPQQPQQGSAPYPQQPRMPYPGQPNAGSAPYPQQPNVGSVPYPRQPGVGYPQQPGVGYPQQPNLPNSQHRPYPQQPNYGNVPHAGGGLGSYPRQPGGNYGAPPPPYAKYSGLAAGSTILGKPNKKKGLLGSVLSHGSPSYHGSKPGGYYRKSHGMSPALFPIIPLLALSLMRPNFFPSFRPPMMFMPYHSPFHHGYYHRNYDFDGYRGGCRRPFVPKHASMECNATDIEIKCMMACHDQYHYEEGVTVKENVCWHVGGVWRPMRNFPDCKPICNVTCLNGGRCVSPNVCHCDPEYRGDVCQYNVFNCNIMNLMGARSNIYSWSCRHARNETTCTVRCRKNPSLYFELMNTREFKCSPAGVWENAEFPNCDGEAKKPPDEESRTNVTSALLTTPLTTSIEDVGMEKTN